MWRDAARTSRILLCRGGRVELRGVKKDINVGIETLVTRGNAIFTFSWRRRENYERAECRPAAAASRTRVFSFVLLKLLSSRYEMYAQVSLRKSRH